MLIFWMSVGCEGMDGGGAWGKGSVTVSFPGVTPMRKYVFEKHKVE